MKLLAILSLCFLGCILKSHASTGTCRTTNLPWCSSCNDPHMRGFDGKPFEFQYSGNFFVMYTNYIDTRVTASFQRCNANRVTPTCNCGIHISFRGALLFLDTCGTIPNGPLEFYYGSTVTSKNVVRCRDKTVPSGKETDDGWWNNENNPVVVPGKKFLCAKHATQPDTFIIRTNDASNNGKNIYVKLILHCRGISCIYIRAAGCDFGKTAGLCGNYSSNPNEGQFIYNCTGIPSGSINSGHSRVPATPLHMSQFWKLHRCAPDELEYKRLDTDTCLCDSGVSKSSDDCDIPLSKCGPSSVGHKVIPSPCGCVHNIDAFPSDRNTAIAVVDGFFNFFKLILAFEAKLLIEELLELLRGWAIMDHMATSDHFWAINTCQIGRNWALDTCGESNKHQLCTEFKIPCKCLTPGFRELLNDDGIIEKCPPKDSCPKPSCPVQPPPNK